MKKFYFLLILTISCLFSAQSDCESAIPVCGNTDMSYTPTGYGNVLETIGGCYGVPERQSVWYVFTAATAGTLTFEIVPIDPTDDYDFAVWGPNKTCSTRGTPDRCNYAGTGPFQGHTGLQLGLAANNGVWSPALNVQPGDVFYLQVNNFSQTGVGFNLTWGGTATLVSPFNDPAIAPNPFNPPGHAPAQPNGQREVYLCSPAETFDFHSLDNDIVNGNPGFYIKYYRFPNDAIADTNAITAPIFVNTTDTYYYTIRFTDPTNPNNAANKCFNTGTFKFKDVSIRTTNATLTECNNNENGYAVYNLTTANVIAANPTHVIKYYPTLADANAGTSEILNPTSYTSAEGNVYAKVTTQDGCFSIATITLKFFPAITVNDATLRACSLPTNPSLGEFNLNNATVSAPGSVRKFYPSETDAINNTNEITNPLNFVSPSGVVYAKVFDANQCYNIAKITLIVIPPVHSTVLKDKIICIEDETTLDAGPGFNKYLWSTGATTQTINDVGVGTYWVELTTGECVARQTVKVFPAEQPVISSIEIGATTVTVNVIGGAAPYQYSMDNIKWQTSNVFENVSRGEAKVYVKDSYDCDPIEITITVPNIINVITPNGDGINDFIDYSALGIKQNLVFSVYDRYGVKIHQADKNNGYKWDGTIAGKKVSTGTYWYSVTWSENDEKSTPIKYSGWVMVKNRE